MSEFQVVCNRYYFAADFRDILCSAVEVAAQGHFVTLGIIPLYAETGFGYIHRGGLVEMVGDTPIYRVLRFTEKPDQTKAEAFVASEALLRVRL